ncbi:hypothetical protein [Salinactinospora qingdaonensis]|uniref:Uncharacterized protein n=1 Tax=Salinactinospora qingdaonensis TaxID=702744 RepID=A0ABP7G8P8_9ACTN
MAARPLSASRLLPFAAVLIALICLVVGGTAVPAHGGHLPFGEEHVITYPVGAYEHEFTGQTAEVGFSVDVVGRRVAGASAVRVAPHTGRRGDSAAGEPIVVFALAIRMREPIGRVLGLTQSPLTCAADGEAVANVLAPDHGADRVTAGEVDTSVTVRFACLFPPDARRLTVRFEHPRQPAVFSGAVP